MSGDFEFAWWASGYIGSECGYGQDFDLDMRQDLVVVGQHLPGFGIEAGNIGVGRGLEAAFVVAAPILRVVSGGAGVSSY